MGRLEVLKSWAKPDHPIRCCFRSDPWNAAFPKVIAVLVMSFLPLPSLKCPPERMPVLGVSTFALASVHRCQVSQEIHVWRIPLDETEDAERLYTRLPPEEQQRASRFRFAEDRRRWVHGRWSLRRVLSLYLGVGPLAVRLIYGPYGKPAVNPEFHDRSWQFNFTHSGQLALLALTHGSRIGVDVEQIREVPCALSLAEDFFCPDEAAEIAACSSHDRADAFLRCWTAKEAYLKARGDGLSAPLKEFRVSFRDDAPSYVLPRGTAPDAFAKWRLYPITPDIAYVAGVVWESGPTTTGPQVVLFHLAPESAAR